MQLMVEEFQHFNTLIDLEIWSCGLSEKGNYIGQLL